MIYPVDNFIHWFEQPGPGNYVSIWQPTFMIARDGENICFIFTIHYEHIVQVMSNELQFI